MPTLKQVLSPELVYRLERGVRRALRTVENEEGIKAGVTLTIEVERDDKDDVVMTYKLKCAFGDQKSKSAGRLADGQLTLPDYDLAGLEYGPGEEWP